MSSPERPNNLTSSIVPSSKENQILPMVRQNIGVSAPERTGGRTPPEVAPSPTKPEKKKSPKPLIGTKTRIALAGLLALEGTGGVINEQINNLPVSARTIVQDAAWPWDLSKTAAEDIQNWFNPKDKVVPSTFDSKADIQTVAPGINTITVGLEELPSVLKGSIKPVEAGKYPDESILFPVKVGNQNIVSSRSYFNGLLNPFTGEEEQHAVDGKILRIPNKGTEIIVPVEGAEVFQLTPRSIGSGRSFFMGAVIRFRGPDGAVHYINIQSSDDTFGQQLALLDTIKKAPFIGDNGFFARPTPETDSLKGMPLPVGTSILKTDVDNAGVHLFLTTSSKILPSGRVLSDFNFVTQDSKIVITPTSQPNSTR